MVIIKGNIIDINKGIIVHQVNCRGKIGAGVSEVIINKYPKVKEEYYRICNELESSELLGNYQSIQVSDELVIINLFSQLNYGNSKRTSTIYTDYNLLIDGIKKICTNNTNLVYIPYGIGCGLAGGDWSVVSEGIKNIDNLIAVRLV